MSCSRGDDDTVIASMWTFTDLSSAKAYSLCLLVRWHHLSKSQVPRPPLAVPRLNHPRTFCAVLRIQSKCQDNQETEPPRHLLPEAQHPKSARRKRTCH